MDITALRLEFPALGREVNGHGLVYLDSAATSQKPRRVIESLTRFYERHNANPHRGVHTLAEEATAAYEGARARVAAFVNAPAPEALVFTRNTTEALNLVAFSWAEANLRAGDEILVTGLEHHSNLLPWQRAAERSGAVLRVLPVEDSGALALDELEELVGGHTRLIAFSGMSNVLGTIVDPAPLVAAARQVGAVTVMDGAQSVPHLRTDFQALGVDFLAFSGHKMLGPTGVGALVARPELLEAMPPFLLGGGMVLDVGEQSAKWIEAPWKFEAGTPAVAEAVALGEAVAFIENLGWDRIQAHEESLVRYALDSFARMDGLRLLGPTEPERRGAVFSFELLDRAGGIVHPHDVAGYLDQLGVAIRAGHHCAKPLVRRFGAVALCRASFYLYNTEAEVDLLIEALQQTRKFFTGA
ncbi:SufS family cysteine desulfurase [bacterium]|nr:SufS family cysteine desulfurase [bacterium]